MKLYIVVGIFIGLVFAVRSPVLGMDGMEGHGTMGSHGTKEHKKHVTVPQTSHEHEGGVLKKVSVDDGSITVNFYLETMDEHRKAMENMKMSAESMGEEMKKEMESATHHLSVSFQDTKTRKMIEKANGTVTVTGPSGTSAKKNLHWMEAMNHFGSCLELKDKGKYQIAAAFTVDGKEKKAGFEYTLE